MPPVAAVNALCPCTNVRISIKIHTKPIVPPRSEGRRFHTIPDRFVSVRKMWISSHGRRSRRVFFFVYFSLAKLRVAQSDLPRVAISRAITHRRTHTLIFASQCSCVCVKCVLDVLACVECLNVWLCGLGNIAPLVLLLLLLFVNQPSKKSENSLQPHFYRVFIFRIETSTTPKSVKHQFQHQNTIRLCPLLECSAQCYTAFTKRFVPQILCNSFQSIFNCWYPTCEVRWISLTPLVVLCVA